MHTASSASRTCIASLSAVEWTATVLMPISWQARWIRSAISPRLAISSFWMAIDASADDDEGLVELDRLAVADHDLADRPALGREDRVHHLHRLDDHQRIALADLLADGDERLGAGLGRQISGADHRRLDRIDRRG